MNCPACSKNSLEYLYLFTSQNATIEKYAEYRRVISSSFEDKRELFSCYTPRDGGWYYLRKDCQNLLWISASLVKKPGCSFVELTLSEKEEVLIQLLWKRFPFPNGVQSLREEKEALFRIPSVLELINQ